MEKQQLENLTQAYLKVLGLVEEEKVESLDEKCATKKEEMDPVDKKALKKDFKDREDKDIDNDGDEDESDEYLHNRRKAVSKAVKEDVEEVDEASGKKFKDYVAEYEKLTGKKAPAGTSMDGIKILIQKAKSVKEDVEELDELSKSTLGSYKAQASGQAQTHATAAQNSNDAHKIQTHSAKAQKRLVGVSRAHQKMMTKEDVEQLGLSFEELEEFIMSEEFNQLDEISQDTLRRYHGAAALDLRKKREKLAHGTMTTQDHKKGQRRVAGLNRAANKMESTDNEAKYGRHAGMLIDYVQEAKDPKAGAVPAEKAGETLPQGEKDFIAKHKVEVSQDAEKANMQNFKDFTAKVGVAKKRPNDNDVGDKKVVK